MTHHPGPDPVYHVDKRVEGQAGTGVSSLPLDTPYPGLAVIMNR